jgi:hypothetical protein
MFKYQQIDVQVNNEIIAVSDDSACFLVRARTSRQIEGSRTYVSGNLPAHLTRVAENLWVVNFGEYQPVRKLLEMRWYKIRGYHIEPRGNTETRGALADMMEGWEHDYIPGLSQEKVSQAQSGRAYSLDELLKER